MADETTTADKPLVVNDNGAAKPPKVEPIKPLVPVDEPEPMTAKTKLRAFEDDVLGKDAPRIDGQIERGHGSLYARETSPEQKVHYVALEHMVKTEKHLADASAALAKAETEHAAAEKAAEAASEAADNASSE